LSFDYFYRLRRRSTSRQARPAAMRRYALTAVRQRQRARNRL